MATNRVTLTMLAATLALAACAPTVFDLPPGADQAQFHRDNLECTMAAKALVGDSLVIGPPLMIAAAAIGHNNDIKAAHDECMLGKSYTVHEAAR